MGQCEHSLNTRLASSKACHKICKKNSLQIIRSDDTKTRNTELTLPIESTRYHTDGTSNPMSNEIGAKSVNEDEDVARDDTETKEKSLDITNEKTNAIEITKDSTEKPENTKEGKENKPRSVSFNRDIHVKRFGESTFEGTK